MTTPETQRRLDQQGNDIEALYELATRIDRKVTDGFTTVDERLTGHDRRFDSLDERLTSVDERLTAHDRRFDTLDAKLDAILSRLSDQ